MTFWSVGKTSSIERLADIDEPSMIFSRPGEKESTPDSKSRVKLPPRAEWREEENELDTVMINGRANEKRFPPHYTRFYLKKEGMKKNLPKKLVFPP